jgi:hypothetical protein
MTRLPATSPGGGFAGCAWNAATGTVVFFDGGSLALRARIYPPNQTNLRFDLMLFSVGSSVTLKCNGGREMEGA